MKFWFASDLHTTSAAQAERSSFYLSHCNTLGQKGLESQSRKANLAMPTVLGALSLQPVRAVAVGPRIDLHPCDVGSVTAKDTRKARGP